MSTINYSNTDIAGNLAYVWTPMALNDTGATAIHPGTADRTVQVFGTFGVGGAVTFEGTLDGTNWATLHDPQGVSIVMTSAGLKTILENVLQIRPRVSAGDGTTSLTAILNVRR